MAKEYDKEIRNLFNDYLKSKSRIQMIDKNVEYGDKKPEEQLEKKRLQCLILTVETMLEQLPPFQKQLIEYFYIYQDSLYDIAELLNYSYYHCSNTKNEAVDKLKSAFSTLTPDSDIGKSILEICTTIIAE